VSEVSVVFDDKSAKNMLKLWCRDRKTLVHYYYSCAQFSYSDRLFWGITVKLFSWEGNLNGTYGFHVYEDGEVKLISKQGEV